MWNESVPRQTSGRAEVVAVDDQAASVPFERPLNRLLQCAVVRPIPAFEKGLAVFLRGGLAQRSAVVLALVDHAHALGCHGLLLIVDEALRINDRPADGEHHALDVGQVEQLVRDVIRHHVQKVTQLFVVDVQGRALAVGDEPRSMRDVEY